MKTSDFFYDLPKELIAQHPTEKRDNSRLMVIDRNCGEIKHRHFYDIVDEFKKGDCLVLNNTRVLPARIYGIKDETGARVEFLLLKQVRVYSLKKSISFYNQFQKILMNEYLKFESIVY